ncbi:hypothetical protein HOE04_00945 [archaeon]|jgi:hypothetical protein|nr:hypothetical protein [archaeon]
MKRGIDIKGQVAVFVIVAILIVGVGGSIGYIVKVKNDVKLNEEFFSQGEVKVQVDNIESAVLDCLEGAGVRGLEIIGLQGGYYNKPLKSFDLDEGFVPYYYDKGEFLMPSREEIVMELENYVSDKFGDCVEGLEFEGFDLSLGKGEVDVVIGDNAVLFEVDKSVKIEKEGKKIFFDLEKHGLSVESALSDILDVAEYIIDSHKENVEMYCISCVGKMADERDVYVQRTLLSDNRVFIVIGENRTSEDVYLFNFINRYSGDEVDNFGLNKEVLPRKPVALGEL